MLEEEWDTRVLLLLFRPITSMLAQMFFSRKPQTAFEATQTLKL